MGNPFTDKDRDLIAGKGMTEQDILDQIDLFKKGSKPLSLNRPCTLGDGIVAIDESSAGRLLGRFDEARLAGRTMKFVPASGAASRMFEKWFRLKESPTEGETRKFLADLPRYPFFRSLTEKMKGQGNVPAGPSSSDPEGLKATLEAILGPRGLCLGELPKAIIPFHRYTDNDIRTALEEQLVEAALHTSDKNRLCRIHFTLSPEHHSQVTGLIGVVQKPLEDRLGLSFEITLTPQHSFTDTLAVDLENRPFRNDSGNLLFRPGGHGALLKNLDDLGGDILFVKNIDNITPDRLKEGIVYYKKLLGGYLLDLQDTIFGYLRLLDGGCDEATLATIEGFCRNSLYWRPPGSYDALEPEERARSLHRVLNRPIRICGMVKNEGEPGGGPFWIDEGDGAQSLQIVEANQVDRTSESQRSLWESSTHFNPVDLVCGLKDYQGRSFSLTRYLDPESFMVAEKSYQGKPLKALELPGLWNGSMARWNTVFVEEPLWTFAPVKTVEDLLRPEHQP